MNYIKMKTAKYILLIAILFNFKLFGASEKLTQKMAYESSYDEALQKAKIQNKPIMMVFAQEGCPFCYKFEVKTLTKGSIDKEVKKNFFTADSF